MYTIRLPRLFGTLALFAACNFNVQAQEVKTVFVIAMENHNFTQPNPTSSPQVWRAQIARHQCGMRSV